MNTLAKAKVTLLPWISVMFAWFAYLSAPGKKIETTLFTFSLFFETIEQTRDHQSSHVNRKKRRNYKYGKIVNR